MCLGEGHESERGSSRTSSSGRLCRRSATSRRTRREVRLHRQTPCGVADTVLCRIMEVTHSGFYEWEGRQASLRSVAKLTGLIRQSFEASGRTYGAAGYGAMCRPGAIAAA